MFHLDIKEFVVVVLEALQCCVFPLFVSSFILLLMRRLLDKRESTVIYTWASFCS